MPRQVRVVLGAARQEAFDYLVDPLRRVEWMSGLRHVDDARPLPPQTGTSWRERGLAEVVTEVTLTDLQPSRAWSETWVCKGTTTSVTYTLDEVSEGCRVTADVQVAGAGRVMRALMERSQPRTVEQSLERAGRVLAEGPDAARPESRGDF